MTDELIPYFIEIKSRHHMLGVFIDDIEQIFCNEKCLSLYLSKSASSYTVCFDTEEECQKEFSRIAMYIKGWSINLVMAKYDMHSAADEPTGDDDNDESSQDCI